MLGFPLRRAFICRAALLAGLLFAGSTGVAAQTENAAPAEKAPVAAPRGVGNFGQVSLTLYRGAQPSAQGFRELKKLGVEIVVDLRNGQSKSERGTVERLGMRYLSIPLAPWRDPTNQQVAEFLHLLSANPQSKVLVHCDFGADRTGTMVAIYRIAAENWTPQRALEEMHAYHYHHRMWPHFERYVEKFPELQASDPKLRPAIASPPGP